MTSSNLKSTPLLSKRLLSSFHMYKNDSACLRHKELAPDSEWNAFPSRKSVGNGLVDKTYTTAPTDMLLSRVLNSYVQKHHVTCCIFQCYQILGYSRDIWGIGALEMTFSNWQTLITCASAGQCSSDTSQAWEERRSFSCTLCCAGTWRAETAPKAANKQLMPITQRRGSICKPTWAHHRFWIRPPYVGRSQKQLHNGPQRWVILLNQVTDEMRNGHSFCWW